MIPRALGFLLIWALSFEQIVGPPAAIKNKHDNDKDHAINNNEVEVDDLMDNSDFDVEYKRYLSEVARTLEGDEEFKKKVESSNVDDIKSGKLALEVDSLHKNIRSKLDELKRQEVQRLRELVKKKEELGHGPLHPSEYEHIDHFNLDTFEVKDLDKLIKKVSKDMEKISEMRKEQFKNYEMEKKVEEELKMRNMTDTEKHEYQAHLEEMKKKHANHEKIHHPGSKAQFEEVWEKQDHLENQEFDPKIFFHLHDVDSNGYWDHEEVKALFIKELDKMYQEGLPEDDMRERQEEMERMKDHVFKEMDTNHDNMISFQEYMEGTKAKEFNQDEGWDTLEKQKIYSQQEYEEFERRRIAELQHMVETGVIPPDRYPGLYHPAQMPGHPNQMYDYHPNQVPQYHPNQVPQQGYHPNQMPQHPNQMPQHPNQMPQHPNQMPQHPNQMPQHPNQMSQHPNQMPQHPNQAPQHPNQVPQHPNQYQNQVPDHPSQQQYQQDYQQNQPPQQQYHPNPSYHSGGQPNQNNQQQYQNNQQQYHPDPNSQQHNQQNNQQYPNQANQQQYHPNQNNQQQYQNQPNNQQYQNQPGQQQYNNQPSQNNKPQHDQSNQNKNNQNQAPSQHANNPQPPAGKH